MCLEKKPVFLCAVSSFVDNIDKLSVVQWYTATENTPAIHNNTCDSNLFFINVTFHSIMLSEVSRNKYTTYNFIM